MRSSQWCTFRLAHLSQQKNFHKINIRHSMNVVDSINHHKALTVFLFQSSLKWTAVCKTFITFHKRNLNWCYQIKCMRSIIAHFRSLTLSLSENQFLVVFEFIKLIRYSTNQRRSRFKTGAHFELLANNTLNSKYVCSRAQCVYSKAQQTAHIFFMAKWFQTD